MNDDRSADGEATEQGGVFGKLPASRPGTRSPRRDGARKASRPKATASASKRKPAASPRARPARPASEPRREPAPAAEPARVEQPQGEQSGGLDDLAWAGVAAVAEAATLGVRIANRALGALRDSVDRR